MRATSRASRVTAVTLIALTASFAACDGVTDPGQRSPLDGLQYAVGTDSVGNPPPPPVGTTTPGYFQGTVLGPSTPGGGPDTLATALRVAGARLAAFAMPNSGMVTPENLGEEIAAVTTGADGKFVFPTLPGGSYVVTVTPPATSIYGGVWVTATVHSTSHEFPWWVVLWKK